MKNIAQEFKGLIYKEDALLTFGFQKAEDGFSYQADFSNGDFSLEIRLQGKEATLEVVDKFSEESYPPFFVPHPMGSFVRQMREEADGLIAKIRETCFEKDYESDYIARFDLFVKEQYNVLPEVTWEEYPNFFTYHRLDNRKWFAIIMQVEYRKLGIEKDGIVNLIDVKADPNEIPSLLEREDIFPGYHMNKKHWITFLLDGSAPFEKLIPLVEKSYALSGEQKVFKGLQGSWVVPGNPKYYDVGAHMARSNELLWKQTARVNVGDTVYLYEGQPIGAIRFVYKVLETNIPYTYEGEVSMTKVMKLKLLRSLKQPFTKKELSDHGVLYIRGARTMPKELVSILEKRK